MHYVTWPNMAAEINNLYFLYRNKQFQNHCDHYNQPQNINRENLIGCLYTTFKRKNKQKRKQNNLKR